MNNKILKIALTGMMTALVFLGTYTIRIPSFISGGYIHFGDAFVLISGLILGPIYGAFAAGIGSSLSDILGGFVPWALPTFLIKGSMAAIMGFFAIKKGNTKVIFIATSIFSIFWIGFNIILKNTLLGQVTSSSTDLLEGLKLSNMEDLLKLSASLQDKLLIAAICLPLILAIILLLIRKFSKANFSLTYSIGFIISGSLMIVGYYFATYILYGSYILPIFEIPMNIIQFVVGIILAHLLLPVVQKLYFAKMQKQ